jgi:hypothetical protein
MNARASENYQAISRSSSASKIVEIFWAEIYWGRLIFRAESYIILIKYIEFYYEIHLKYCQDMDAYG